MITVVRQSTLRARLLTGVTVALLVCSLTIVVATRSWAEEYRAGERMLPGVTVAAVGVGDLEVDDARSEVESAFERRRDRDLTVSDGDRTWTTTPRDLGARADVADAVSAATEVSSATGWAQLTAVRWAGEEVPIEVEASLRPDDEEVAALIDDIAAEVDTEPVPATARWTAEGAAVVDDIDGRSVDRDAAADAVAAAVRDGEDSVDLPTRDDEAGVLAADVRAVLPAIEDAVERTVERSVTLTDGHGTWQAPIRELAARPADIGGAVASAVDLAAEGAEPEEIAAAIAPLPLAPDDGAVDGLLDEIGEEAAVEPVNAGLDHSTGWVELTPSSEGRQLELEGANEAVVSALREGADEVELPTEAVEPTRTRSHYRDVVLVRHDDRRVYHYRNGEIVADWPAAIGTDEQPTPTGVFTIGAKRHMPTWRNPAPDRWGADMPEVVEPGPSNPLGVRALNWNRRGEDTLIRFHGTANVDSIGQASSNGCVRLSNPDIIELYDRIPSGTPVVSVHG